MVENQPVSSASANAFMLYLFMLHIVASGQDMFTSPSARRSAMPVAPVR